ncbi:alpha/beta fold hydrolase [Halovivax gelatinilyticus]|uniref:alpha/beta fold hydrolase n=1 Tax=Halovivax gelatinilyticus TaxID=2961597 RepID=UPI0020CA7CC0|nr:alpha/beta hydrolase [Halovivax gelatinilyticus]
METVSHHGRVTAYRRVNREAGPGCCFVHGSGGTGRVWNGQLKLAGRTPLSMVDLSGHGESEDVDADPGYQTLSAYADDVLAVRDRTDDRILVGTSLGAAVVLHLCIDRNVDVDGIVLTGAGARLGVLDDLLTWLERDFDRAIEFLHEPGRFLRTEDPDVVSRSKSTLVETGRTVTQRDFLTCHEFDVREQLDAVDVPALVVYGSDDRLTPPWYHQHLAEMIPESTLVEIEDAAHLAMIDRPDAFNSVLAEFIDSIGD